MEGSWQGLLVTYEAWLFYFHKVCWKRFCGHGHKEYTEQICDLAQESVTWQWQGHMQFEKAYSTRQDDFIFSEKKTPVVLWKVDLVVRGWKKKKAWLVSCGFVFKS